MSLRESAAASSSFDQRPSVAGLPHGVAFDHLDRLDARLAALAPLDHALHRLERVVVHRVRAADADHQRLLDLAPSGNSRSGSRHVTGSDEPASIGNLSRFDVSTIPFAFSKLYERCLSL